LDDLVTAVQQWQAESTHLAGAILRDASDDLALAEMWDADRRLLSKLNDESPGRCTQPPLLATLHEELAAVDRQAEELQRQLLNETN
jgi:hypothetical protein